MNRYHRQILLPQIGDAGQERLSSSRVLLIGCGALGTVIADQLVRGGVGLLRIADRDVVELTNLQRQTLFDESDAAAGLPKAVAAAARLAKVNSTVRIEPYMVDIQSDNVEKLADGVDIVLDGTDNAQTRYLINDAAIKRGLPWVYGACVGTTGRALGIIPNRGPCLRCIFPEPPGPGELQTCDTAGVLAAASTIAASLQVVEAIRILLADSDAGKCLVSFDLFPLRFRAIETTDARRPECPTCGQRVFEFLDRKFSSSTTILCGRDTVQVRPACGGSSLDLASLAKRLSGAGAVQASPFFVRCTLAEAGCQITIFPDGRALIHGISDLATARLLYAKYVGE